jgi:hypothetical protein
MKGKFETYLRSFELFFGAVDFWIAGDGHLRVLDENLDFG